MNLLAYEVSSNWISYWSVRLLPSRETRKWEVTLYCSDAAFYCAVPKTKLSNTSSTVVQLAG
jgi:hypothetical protein